MTYEDKPEIQRIGELVRKFESAPDPSVRADARELVRALMKYHGAAIGRMMEMISEAPEAQPPLFDGFARDELISSLLLLYGLHPVDLETRVARALDKVRPMLRAQACDVHLLGIENSELTLRFEGKPARHLKAAIEEEIYKLAADITTIHMKGFESFQKNGLVQVSL